MPIHAILAQFTTSRYAGIPISIQPLADEAEEGFTRPLACLRYQPVPPIRLCV